MKPVMALTVRLASALLTLGIAAGGAAAAGAAAPPLQYSACASAACAARWSALESALAAAFGEAERDGAAGITQPGGVHRYALSRPGPQLQQWAASGGGARVLVFARRAAGATLRIDSVVFLDAASKGWEAASAPRTALVLKDGAALPEQHLWQRLSALTQDPAMIKKRQTLTGLVAAMRDSRQLLALVKGGAAGELSGLAFVPDAIHISLQGAAAANSDAADPDAYADSAPPVGSVNQYGTVVSSQPGAVATLVKSADGKTASLRFDIDPKKFGGAANADPAAASPDTLDALPDPAQP